jgi:hypothetical protein
MRRRDFLTGSAALAACAQIRDAEALTPQQRFLLGGAGKIVAPAFDPNWFHSYQLGGTMPSVVLDFVGGRYYDGTNNKAAVSSMLSGAALTIDGTGLLLNSASLVASGALLAAMQASDITVCAEVSGGVAGTNLAIISFGPLSTSDGIMFETSANQARSRTGVTNLLTVNTSTWTGVNRIGSSKNAAGRGIALNGSTGIEDTAVIVPPTSVFIGSLGGSFIYGGKLRALYVIPRRVATAELGYSSLAPAWTGSNALFSFGTNFVDMGNVLQFERTQPWSFGAAIVMGTALPATAAVIATNVTTSTAFPGIDLMFVNSAGKLHVRLINNITSNFIGVFGSTLLNDGKPHYAWSEYSGSGLASGVTLYVDGVPETLTVESDTLAGLSTVAAGQNLFIGNQKNHTDFVFNGIIDAIRMSNIVRGPAYIAAHSKPATVPPIDANTVLALDFEEGTGTTTADSSASGFTGTLSSSAMWART